jgi:hypothetical protein
LDITNEFNESSNVDDGVLSSGIRFTLNFRQPLRSLALDMRNEIPGFWKEGPHTPVPVEATWREFVRSVGGEVIEDLVPEPRNFQNADFLFSNESIVIELKEIVTEFTSSPSFTKGFDQIMRKLVEEKPDWRPTLFGGDGIQPKWFNAEFVRIFRPQFSRILKKANNQIKETKAKFKITSPTGVVVLVNDGFTSIGPSMLFALACNILANSYSSIDAFVYMTVNRYIEVPGSDEPRLIWLPSYSPNADADLVNFINALGSRWFDFLEVKVEGFTSRTVIGDLAILSRSKAIVY